MSIPRTLLTGLWPCLLAALAVACDGGIKVEPGDTDTDTDGDTTTDTSVDGDPGDAPDDPDGTTDPDGTSDPDADTGTDPEPDGPVADTDGDTISDAHEGSGTVDTDGDGTPDSEDTDSDDDGIPDADEAGDTDLGTPPDDCEGDGTPNFRDTDSDDDGVADSGEVSHGTDPCNPDSDGDGVSDLSEIAYGSDPTDPDDNPTAAGDFVFLVPYLDTPDPTLDTLVFSTNLKVGDIYFAIDQTPSLMDELSEILGAMTSTIIPGIQSEIADSWFGVGAFQECSSSSGGGCANGMAVLQMMTGDTAAVVTTLSDMSDDFCGANEPYRAFLYATASGDLSPFSGWPGVHPSTWTCTPPGAIGWPCFREHAVPIIIHLGDEDFDDAAAWCSPDVTHEEVVEALSTIEAKYIGINAGTPGWGNPRDDMVAVATATGSVDTGGNPLVYDTAGSTSLATQIVDAVSLLATAVPIRVDAIAEDDPADMVDAIDEFVERINTNTSGSSIWDPILGEMRTCTSGIPTSTPGLEPPTLDYFEVVEPGQSVCFDIVPRENTTIPATTVPLIFRAVIHVIGDEHTPLDDRAIYFVVPPEIPGS